ncbi:MAG: tRNA-dihydrouridine synthase, partial [Anaerolineae bacterium]|nr:tRNA-dihydrouridine synthase [Anaerolineae bacterium]
ARAAQDVGVKAIAVHARFAVQGFSGEPDWRWIRKVKEAVDVPVIGNGDVRTADDARRMFEETGCDAVMIGRAALGRPWVFRQIAHKLRTGEDLSEPLPSEKIGACLEHARLTLESTRLPVRQAILEMRGQLTQYSFGVPGAAAIRDQLVHMESLEDVERVLLPVLERERTREAAASPRREVA